MSMIGHNGPPDDTIEIGVQWVAGILKLRDDLELSRNATVVGYIVNAYCGFHNAATTVSMRRIQDRLGMKRTTVKAAFEELVERGHLRPFETQKRRKTTIELGVQLAEALIILRARSAVERNYLRTSRVRSLDPQEPICAPQGSADTRADANAHFKTADQNRQTADLTPQTADLRGPMKREERKKERKKETTPNSPTKDSKELPQGTDDQIDLEQVIADALEKEAQPKKVSPFEVIVAAFSGDGPIAGKFVGRIASRTGQGRGAIVTQIAQAIKRHSSGLVISNAEILLGNDRVEPQQFFPFLMGTLKKTSPADHHEWQSEAEIEALMYPGETAEERAARKAAEERRARNEYYGKLTSL